MSEDLKNILIIKPSSLGDIVQALPALSALRRSFPDTKISWLIRPEFAPLLEGHPHLTRTIIFDRKLLGKALKNRQALGALLSLISQLQKAEFDTVLDFQGLFRTAALGWLSGCRKRLGMADSRELAHIFYTQKITQDQSCIHLVDYYLKIVKAAGATDTGVEFVLPIDNAAADSVKKLLAARSVEGDYAVFVPGSARSNKCWPAEYFAALAERVTSEFGLAVVATGTVEEMTKAEKLKQLANVPVINLAGQTSIRELTALLKSAKLVVSNDTGPGHIAAALGVRVVLIFGPTNPARVAPYGRSGCVAAVDPDNRGLKSDSTNPRHRIEVVTVDMVFDKIREQLNS